MSFDLNTESNVGMKQREPQHFTWFIVVSLLLTLKGYR